MLVQSAGMTPGYGRVGSQTVALRKPISTGILSHMAEQRQAPTYPVQRRAQFMGNTRKSRIQGPVLHVYRLTHFEMNRLFALSARIILRFRTADKMITPVINNWSRLSNERHEVHTYCPQV